MRCLGMPATAANRLRVSNVLDQLDYNGSPFRKSQSRSSFPLGEYGSNGFTERFRGKQIHASQHLYRMQSCMNGLFPGLKKCPLNAFYGSFTTSAALFESLSHNPKRTVPTIRRLHLQKSNLHILCCSGKQSMLPAFPQSPFDKPDNRNKNTAHGS